MSFFKTLKEKLAKSRNSFVNKVAEALSLRVKVDKDLMDDLEEILIQADVGPELSSTIIEELEDEVRINNVSEPADVQKYLMDIISKKLVSEYIGDTNKFFKESYPDKPHVILIIGVNGTGKTTSIGKIASQFKKQGKSVLVVAADTFRAAAIEQLTIWAERVDIPIFKRDSGSDPASVVYDGLAHANSKKYDIVLIDTAGRQHNKVQLMAELGKIFKTIQKVIPNAPHETLLVLDSTTGQNAIAQAKFFNEVTPISGIVLSKFDGTAKGGMVIAVKHQLNIPVKLIGIGETIEDLKEFDAKEFAEALFG